MYATKKDAVGQEIIPALGEYVDDFDIDKIFDRAFEYSADLQAFVQTVDTEGFWVIAQEAEK